MIIKCSNEWKERIFSYIGNDYEKCLYIYSDLIKYGMDSQYVTTWVNIIDDSIRAIVMRYHNGMHIYSECLDYNKDEIVKLIRKIEPSMILGIEDIIVDLSDMLDEYNNEYGYIKRMKKHIDIQAYDNIKIATAGDVASLADMLMSDEKFSEGYIYDEMYKQISERILDGYGKTFYIYDKNKILSQLGIAAELDRFVVISNVYTAKEYRGQGYAGLLFSYVRQITEGKNVYLFCYGDTLDKYYDKIGFETVQPWGKLLVKNIKDNG